MGSISASAFSGVAALIGVLFPVIAVLLIATRTRRSHSFLMHRLWQIIYGPREIEDPLVKRHVDEETVVAVFRTRYNIPVQTVPQVHRLIEWARAREISIRTLGNCGPYFDFVRCEIREKLPSARKMKGLAVFVTLLGACAISIFCLGTESSVLAQFKDSKRYFLINRDVATPLFPRGPALSRNACTSTVAVPTAPNEFASVDREILCKAFNEKATHQFVKSGLKAQRIVLAGLLSAILFIGFFLFGTVQELQATYCLKKVLEEKPGEAADDQGRYPDCAALQPHSGSSTSVS